MTIMESFTLIHFIEASAGGESYKYSKNSSLEFFTTSEIAPQDEEKMQHWGCDPKEQILLEP